MSIVRSPKVEQIRSIRVLLRPGRYVLREAIIVQAPRSVRVEIETMEMPDSFLPIDDTAMTVESEPAGKRKSSRSLLKILSCRTAVVEEAEDELAGVVEFFEPSMLTSTENEREKSIGKLCRKRASLVLRTRRHNEPIIRVRQGTAVLRNLDLNHVSLGIGKFTFLPLLYRIDLFVLISFSCISLSL